MKKTAIVTPLALAALAITTAFASATGPGPADIAACSVASRAELLLWAQSHPGTSHIDVCRAAQ